MASGSTVRSIAAWAMGLAAFVAMSAGAVALVAAIGLPTEYSHATTTVHWGRGAESETDGGMPTYLFALVVASAIAAYRVGLSVDTGRLDGGLATGLQISLRFWFFGLVACAVTLAALQLTLGELKGFAFNVISLGAAAIVGYAFFVLHRLRQREWAEEVEQHLAEMKNSKRSRQT